MKAIIGFILFIFVLAGTLVMGEGLFGLRPFIAAEPVFLVVSGTAVIVLFTFPLKTILESIKSLFSGNPEADKEAKTRACDLFRTAAHLGLAMGAITTILGVILVLYSIMDFNRLPIRMALALTGLFYGSLLYVFFGALENQIRHSRASGDM
jgi:flagellar motor component MotA